jgi:hypothetical protein
VRAAWDGQALGAIDVPAKPLRGRLPAGEAPRALPEKQR